MPDIHLQVPYVSQINIGGHAGSGHDELTGCWYASTCMVAYFRETGPRMGVVSLYKNPDGTPLLGPTGDQNPRPINSSSLPTLMANEGLTPVPLPASKAWTIDGLSETLRTCGPCLVGRATELGVDGSNVTGGHFIVLIGTISASNLVILHDPQVGPNLTWDIKQLNAYFPWNRPEAEYLMMVKLPVLPNGQHEALAN